MPITLDWQCVALFRSPITMRTTTTPPPKGAMALS